MKRVKDAFDERAAALDGLLGVGRSFDMIGRTLRIGGRRARLWVVNGYADDTVLERAISAWLPIPSLEDVGTLQAFADRYVRPSAQTSCSAPAQRMPTTTPTPT